MAAPAIAAVALSIGLIALLLLALAYRGGRRRSAQNQLQPADMGDAALTRAIRAHLAGIGRIAAGGG